MAARPLRTVLVTGASSGIGEACAERLVRGGWRVVAGVRTPGAAPAGTEEVLLDVTDPDQIAAAADRVGADADGLVNNAGMAVAAPLELLPLDELRRQLEVNVVGQIAVTQALLPALRNARGRVVLIGSIGGRSALPFLGAYAASKFALEAVSDALRLELRPFGIEVSIVEPGTIATAIWARGGETANQIAAGWNDDQRALYAAGVGACTRPPPLGAAARRQTRWRRRSSTPSRRAARERGTWSAATPAGAPAWSVSRTGCATAFSPATSASRINPLPSGPRFATIHPRPATEEERCRA